jgi:hypothetical protein
MDHETESGRTNSAPPSGQTQTDPLPVEHSADVPAGTPVAAEVPPDQPARRYWPAIVLVLLIAVLAGILWQHDRLSDWLVTRGYAAPASVVQLAQDDQFTAYANRLFYVNKPQIETRDSFNKHCSSAKDQVTVLGCYTGNRQGIYIYDITDARLEGIKQVTAAHEMLHQAYDRLDAKTKATVNRELQDYYKTVTDPGLKAKIATYQRTEPHDVVNEMHSVFGTEVAKLPAPLEQYYSRYFQDRSKITGYHDTYQAAFDQRTAQIADYDKQIASLKKQIADDKASIAAQEKDLQTQRSHMNDLLSANQTGDYNALVPGFNYQVNIYKQTVEDTNNLIDQYNNLIDSRNQIAVQEQQLQSAIDSHASAAPAQ